MSWLNLNDSFNNLKGQLSNFASNVLADDITGVDGAEQNTEELHKLCVSQQQEIARLRKLNDELVATSPSVALPPTTNEDGDANWSWELKEDTTNSAENISDLIQKITELENDKKELIKSLELLDVDFQQNTEKLVVIKDDLQKNLDALEVKYGKLQDENKELLCQRENYKQQFEELQNNQSVCTKCADNVKLQHDLQNQLEELKNEINLLTSNNATVTKILDDTKLANEKEINDFETKLKLSESENKILVSEISKLTDSVARYEKQREIDAENFKKLASILEGYETKVTSLKNELELSRISHKTDDDAEVTTLKTQIENLQSQLKNSVEDTHKTYLKTLEQTIKRLKDFDLDDSCQNNSEYPANASFTEFNQQIQYITKLFSDLKSQSEKLEKDIYNITQEKTNLLTKKNHEIEKLLQNSEILSQEVITKSQTIKDYEHEINELIKNNDLLINELDEYKNSSGLQTISETNEDNLLLLETQLDNAHKRIEQLEHIINQHENKLVEETNDDVLEEIRQENRELTKDINRLNNKMDILKGKNEELLKTIEKNKTDLENTEYQYTEMSINLESLKDENEIFKKLVPQLTERNKLIDKLKFDLERTNEEYRTELNITKEKLLLEEDARKDFENQVRNLTEKLQSSKMSETSHKLQYDTINKKLSGLVEAKSIVEKQLQETVDDLEQYKGKCKEIEAELDVTKQLYSTQLQLQKHDGAISYDTIPFEIPTTDKDFISVIDQSTASTATTTADAEKTVKSEIDAVKSEEVENTKLMLEELNGMRQQLDEITQERNKLQAQIDQLSQIELEHNNCIQNTVNLQNQLKELQGSKDELTNVVVMKHQENVTYHNEIQRLSQILTFEMEKSQSLHLQVEELKHKQSSSISEELEKLTDQNSFLKEKCDILTKNLLDEQNKFKETKFEWSEKETVLTKKLDRLEAHLLELEDHYTQELLKAEEKNAELLGKVSEIEEREKMSSTMYTSVNIRANQHVETLQNQLQTMTNQRDELRKKISDAEDHANKQAAALANLQFVLEQFQKDKENDVRRETDRIRKQIEIEIKVQDSLREEIRNLQIQLDESKQGLLAASRLSDQLEQSRQQVSTLKIEVNQLKEKLIQSEEQLKTINSHTDGKVDKSLIKNLIIGFITTNNNLTKDQIQILKIIAIVLDFNQQDNDKLHLNKIQPGGWLTSLLTPQASQGMSQESLSQAFVKFLENESKPRVIPSLLNNNDEMVTSTTGNTTPMGTKSRKNSAARQSPIVLSEVVLPTFTDFAQSRSSSSILKDVLKDGS